MSNKIALRNALRKMEEKPGCSEAYKWLISHYEEIIHNRRYKWHPILEVMEQDGIKGLSVKQIAEIWFRVKRAKAKDEAWKAEMLIHSNKKTTSVSPKISAHAISNTNKSLEPSTPVYHIQTTVPESEKREEPSEELKQERRRKALEKFEAHFEKRDRLNNLNLG